jgi:pyruvyl transferase EpsO
MLSDLRLPPRRTGGDLALIARLERELDTVLEPLLPRDRPLALIDFPNHGNVGDVLIWLGERRWLSRHGYEVAYVADQRSYSARVLRRRIGRGPVLIHGGGNLGDVWPQWQRFRERVVAELHDHRVIQLPQSVHFATAEGTRRAAAALGAHPDLHVLCRDAESVAFVRERLGCAAAPAPDMAFALGPLRRAGEPDADVLVLSRTDAERTAAALNMPGALVTDWTTESPDDLGWSRSWETWQRRTWNVGRRLHHPTPQTLLAMRALGGAYEWLARDRARFGRRLLSRGRVVLTDRLHAHVLALLLGVPNVVVDTGYGKLTRFVTAWTRESELSRLAGGAASGRELADALLARRAGGPRAA